MRVFPVARMCARMRVFPVARMCARMHAVHTCFRHLLCVTTPRPCVCPGNHAASALLPQLALTDFPPASPDRDVVDHGVNVSKLPVARSNATLAALGLPPLWTAPRAEHEAVVAACLERICAEEGDDTAAAAP